MADLQNMYLVRTNLRTNMDSNPDLNMNAYNGWEDELDADLRRLVLEHADRTVRYKYYEYCALDLPPELVPAENMEYYKARLVEQGVEVPPEPITFKMDTVRSLEVARERHGILGPLTVTFADEVDQWWWGFRDDEECEFHGDEGTLNLDPDIIGPALDVVGEYTGITRIRLVPEALEPEALEPEAQEPEAAGQGERAVRYRVELVRDGVHGHQRMVITLPRPYYVESQPDWDMRMGLDTFSRDMQEQLHLRLAVVENGVYEFSV
jgi:hypothetical protein